MRGRARRRRAAAALPALSGGTLLQVAGCALSHPRPWRSMTAQIQQGLAALLHLRGHHCCHPAHFTLSAHLDDTDAPGFLSTHLNTTSGASRCATQLQGQWEYDN